MAQLLNSTNVGRNPASVLPAPVGAISSAERSSRRLLQQRQLMRARRPAARGEPFLKMVGEKIGLGFVGGRHR